MTDPLKAPSLLQCASRPRVLAPGLAAVLLGLAAIVLTAPAAAAFPGPVTAIVTINGRAVAHAGDTSPIRLDPKHPAQVALTVANRGRSAVTIAAVAGSGRALDITFFDFEPQTGLVVQAGATESEQFTVDFAPLNGQGNGLIPALHSCPRRAPPRNRRPIVHR